jgi:ABC-type branched-subunit amino acid transport system substrate-binding protein
VSGGPYPSAIPPGVIGPGGARRRSRGPVIAAIAAGVVVLLLAIGGIAFALSGDDDNGGGPGNPQIAACGYKIAYLGILSGEDSIDGQVVRNGARLAVDKYNRSHDGCTVELVEYDTKGEDDEAVRLAEELVRDEKVVGVIGPLWYSEAQRVMPVLETAGVTAISPYLSHTILSERGWKTFHRTIGSDADQAEAGARYLLNTMKARRVFVVADIDEYATKVGDGMRLRLNTAFVGRAGIDGSEGTFGLTVQEILKSTADAIYFAGYYRSGAILVKELRAAKPDIKILGWNRLYTDLFPKGAGTAAAEGVVITCPCLPPDEAKNNFVSDYKERFQDTGIYAPESFDAANALLSALGAGKSSRADVLAHVNAYEAQGVSGPIKFTAAGDLDPTNPTIWAYQIKSGGINKAGLIPVR